MRFVLLVAGLLLGLACAGGGARAGDSDADLQALHDATLAAFQSGDTAETIRRAEAALAAARRLPDLSPDPYAWAFNNLAFVLSTQTDQTARAGQLWHEILAYLQARDLINTDVGLTTVVNLAHHEMRAGLSDQARDRILTTMRNARGGPAHARAAFGAAMFFLDTGAYVDGVVALNEMALIDTDLLRPFFGDLYSRISTMIETAEAENRGRDIATLVEAKIIVLRTFMPPQEAIPAIRNLQFQRYFALRETGDFDRARNEILVWLNTGTRTELENEFVSAMTDTLRQLAGGANINTLERLETVQNAAGIALVDPDLSDHRIGLALRVLASAEDHLGQADRAARTLQNAIEILRRSEAGRRHVHHAMAHLAWSLYLRGDYGQAEAMFQRADQARDHALTLGPDPEPPLDLAVEAANRAFFLYETDRPDQARAFIDRARALLGDRPQSPDAAWPWMAQQTRLTELEFFIAGDSVDPDTVAETLFAAIDRMRAVAPRNSPDFAMTLANIADTTFMAGHSAASRTLLEEAVQINAVALPETSQQSIAALSALAARDIIAGDRAAGIAHLRQTTAALKSPTNRFLLQETTDDFERLAWALVDGDTAPAPEAANEAFEALQWTQITRSAEALSLLETRLSVEDAGRGQLLRQRQDLIDRHASLADQLAATRARKTADTASVQPLVDALEQAEIDLAQIETTLGALGLNAVGVGKVTPLAIADVQALLRPDELLVTFLLPSLNPAFIAGLDASSNHVIAISSTGFHMARLGEISRRNLNARIKTFRCDVAVSDPGCDTGGAEGLRGAMILNAPEPDDPGEPFFDFDSAYALYDDLFGGLAQVLADHEHLIIAPPPDMLRLPFQALVTEPGSFELAQAPWMIRRHAISVLPSITSLRSLRGGSAGPRGLDSMLGFGDPVTGVPARVDCATVQVAALRAAPPDGRHMRSTPDASGLVLADQQVLSDLPRLPDSVCELRAIGAGFGSGNVSLHLDVNATETRIKDMDATGGLAAFDVLVFATHGLTAGQGGADAPGLVLTPPVQATARDDGLLTAAEIAMLDLNAELVVLSACNTAAGAAGDQDGLSGLARAFFQAGAKSLLVTHWSVYSEAAVDVSTGMFATLNANPDQRHGAALRQATLAILSDPAKPILHKHPSYWAAFSIVGAT